jgi:alpha-N-arabinofuranosidase
VVIFALNRHLTETMDLKVELRGFGGQRQIVEALEVHHPNMKAVNTKDAPNTVAPAPIKSVSLDGDKLVARLMPGSWNVIVTAPKA